VLKYSETLPSLFRYSKTSLLQIYIYIYIHIYLLLYENSDGCWWFPVLLKHCRIIISLKGNGSNISVFFFHLFARNDSLWPVFWLDADAGDGMLQAPGS